MLDKFPVFEEARWGPLIYKYIDHAESLLKYAQILSVRSQKYLKILTQRLRKRPNRKRGIIIWNIRSMGIMLSPIFFIIYN